MLPDSLLGKMSPSPIPQRVLIVDDDVTIRELLGALLASEGYAVESAQSGEAALALLRRPDSAPDLVLADVQMPGTTGIQLARKLRRACGPATLLLGISGSQPPAGTISFFDGFLLKPFKMEQVADALLAWSHSSLQLFRQATTNASPKKKKTGVSEPGRTRVSRSISVSASAQKAASKRSMRVENQDSKPTETVDHESATLGPVLNKIIYGQLAGSMPTPQLQELYTLCVDDARKRIAGMRVLAASRDSTQFVREAHSIKGGCGMLGATELHRLAAELEANGLAPGSAGPARDANSLDELSAACDRLERMLRTRV